MPKARRSSTVCDEVTRSRRAAATVTDGAATQETPDGPCPSGVSNSCETKFGQRLVSTGRPIAWDNGAGSSISVAWPFWLLDSEDHGSELINSGKMPVMNVFELINVGRPIHSEVVLELVSRGAPVSRVEFADQRAPVGGAVAVVNAVAALLVL